MKLLQQWIMLQKNVMEFNNEKIENKILKLLIEQFFHVVLFSKMNFMAFYNLFFSLFSNLRRFNYYNWHKITPCDIFTKYTIRSDFRYMVYRIIKYKNLFVDIDNHSINYTYTLKFLCIIFNISILNRISKTRNQ